MIHFLEFSKGSIIFLYGIPSWKPSVQAYKPTGHMAHVSADKCQAIDYNPGKFFEVDLWAVLPLYKAWSLGSVTVYFF